jgi:NAD(P)-dependent dehydrogenase (short-subunit alcohol dehydrogenase family)
VITTDPRDAAGVIGNPVNVPVALVTGAAGGIGRAAAIRFAEENYALVLTDISQKLVDSAAESIQEEFPDTPVLAVACDVASPDSVETMRTAVESWSGRVDVLALIAGVVQDATPITQMTIDQWDKVHGVNLRGVFLCTRAMIPLMPEHAGASIVTMASWWGRAGQASFSAYCSSKAGLISLTQSLAAELAKKGIRANAVAPGNIDTGLYRDALQVWADQQGVSFDELKNVEAAKIPLGYAGPPATIADAVAFLASERASYITGATLDVNGGVMFN